MIQNSKTIWLKESSFLVKISILLNLKIKILIVIIIWLMMLNILQPLIYDNWADIYKILHLFCINWLIRKINSSYQNMFYYLIVHYTKLNISVYFMNLTFYYINDIGTKLNFLTNNIYIHITERFNLYYKNMLFVTVIFTIFIWFKITVLLNILCIPTR